MAERESLPASEAEQAIAAPPIRSPAFAITPFRRLVAASFLISIGFSSTATPVLYAFRSLICEDYWEGSEYRGTGDRCAVGEIEAATAQSVALLTTITTLAGLVNLLSTSLLMRKYGVRVAMVMQAAWPAARNVVQSLAIREGGIGAIRVLSSCQLVTILGGGQGWVLVANSFIYAIVEAEDRAKSFAILQGASTLGGAIGYLAGGSVGDRWGLPVPLALAAGLFAFTALFAGLALPYIPPGGAQGKAEKSAPSAAWSLFVAPLRVFCPRDKPESASMLQHYARLLLATGTFVSVLATSVIPLLLQLTSTNDYAFTQTENGTVMSLYSLCRGLFLSFALPAAIVSFRRWSSHRAVKPRQSMPVAPLEELYDDEEAEESDALLSWRHEVDDTVSASRCDLLFLQVSCLMDAVLATSLAFMTRGWHVFLAAAILPLASGSGPAAKAVIVDFTGTQSQADALAGIVLLETSAGLLASSLFGLLFAALSQKGLAHLTYLFNGGTAFAGFCILLLVRRPRLSRAMVT